ncbi:MAG: hypothetical protein FWF79_09420 [Defluviitaleaceae bacterium]|nr:hypothetical protein [Defluviitaleaceae bacterium]
MGVTVVLVALIIGFMAVTIFALSAMLVVRKREKNREDSETIEKTIEDLDSALNSALAEINKLGALVQNEINDKYKSVLFLYNLVEDKQKEIAESADGEVIAEILEQKLKMLAEKAEGSVSSQMVSEKIASENIASENIASEKTIKTPEPAGFLPEGKKPASKFTNPKHKQIWEMREGGQKVSEIAKELGMGQGEVKLILDLVERAS